MAMGLLQVIRRQGKQTYDDVQEIPSIMSLVARDMEDIESLEATHRGQALVLDAQLSGTTDRHHSVAFLAAKSEVAELLATNHDRRTAGHECLLRMALGLSSARFTIRRLIRRATMDPGIMARKIADRDFNRGIGGGLN